MDQNKQEIKATHFQTISWKLHFLHKQKTKTQVFEPYALSPHLCGVFQSCVDVALRDRVSGHAGGGLSLGILEVFSNTNNSMNAMHLQSKQQI